MCQPHGLRIRRTYRLVLRQRLVNLTQVLKVVVLEGLSSGHSIAIVVDKQFGDDLLGVG